MVSRYPFGVLRIHKLVSDVVTWVIPAWSSSGASVNTGLTVDCTHYAGTVLTVAMSWVSSSLKICTRCRSARDGASLNTYVPAGSAVPGTSTGSPNVTAVFLSQVSAWVLEHRPSIAQTSAAHADATALYAANYGDTGFDFYTLSVTANGVSLNQDFQNIYQLHQSNPLRSRHQAYLLGRWPRREPDGWRCSRHL